MIGRGTRPASHLLLSYLTSAKERIAAIAQSSKPHLTVIDVIDECDRHRVSLCKRCCMHIATMFVSLLSIARTADWLVHWLSVLVPYTV
jgi:hypothetical protein